MAKERIIFAWSGGKDSALALGEILRCGGYEVAELLTTCTEGYRRVSMHGVRCSLLKSQAEALGLPLRKVFIPRECSNADYEERMEKACLEYKAAGISKVGFGDLFLEEIRRYRERMLGKLGMSGIYPLWGRETRAMGKEFLAMGFRAVLVCVDGRVLEGSLAGRAYDEKLLEELPAKVDPCGENGEFHTFVYDGPIFRGSVRFRRGEVVRREHFYFADLLPVWHGRQTELD